MPSKNKNAANQCGAGAGGLGAGPVPGGKAGAAPCQKHWVGVRVEDEDGAIVKDIQVHAQMTDGSDFTMNLASQPLWPDGSYHTQVVLPAGTCNFGLPDVHDVEWWPKGGAAGAVPPDDSDSAGHGVCASSIAARREFRNYHSFWDDPKNKPLKDKNRNPNQLSTDDEVYYSTRKKKMAPQPVDAVLALVVKKPRPIKLRIVLFDHDGKPIANARWTMTSPVSKNGTTGADGLIEIDNFPPKEEKGNLDVVLPARAKFGRVPANPAGAPLAYPPPLVYTDFKDSTDKEPPERDTAHWTLKIGSLPPFNTKEGVRGRIGNMGFRCKTSSNDKETTRAVKAYQRFVLNNHNGSGVPSDIQDDAHTRHDNP
jgi:hypothetical protein